MVKLENFWLFPPNWQWFSCVFEIKKIFIFVFMFAREGSMYWEANLTTLRSDERRGSEDESRKEFC